MKLYYDGEIQYIGGLKGYRSSDYLTVKSAWVQQLARGLRDKLRAVDCSHMDMSFESGARITRTGRVYYIHRSFSVERQEGNCGASDLNIDYRLSALGLGDKFQGGEVRPEIVTQLAISHNDSYATGCWLRRILSCQVDNDLGLISAEAAAFPVLPSDLLLLAEAILRNCHDGPFGVAQKAPFPSSELLNDIVGRRIKAEGKEREKYHRETVRIVLESLLDG